MGLTTSRFVMSSSGVTFRTVSSNDVERLKACFNLDSIGVRLFLVSLRGFVEAKKTLAGTVWRFQIISHVDPYLNLSTPHLNVRFSKIVSLSDESFCRYAVPYEDKGRSERDIVGDAIAS